MAAVLAGCAAKSPDKDLTGVMLTRQPAPLTCDFIGEVSGSQGALLTADSTHAHELMQAARNVLRHNALKMGANYVVLENQTQSVNAQGPGGVYNASVFGNAYACPMEQAQSVKLAG